MPINIPLNVARRRITVDGVLTVLGVVFVVAYLIAPQFVAGLVWDAVNTAVNFWAVS